MSPLAIRQRNDELSLANRMIDRSSLIKEEDHLSEFVYVEDKLPFLMHPKLRPDGIGKEEIVIETLKARSHSYTHVNLH